MIILILIAMSIAFLGEASIPVHALQSTKIELKVSNERPLRGDLVVITGRLSTASDDRPIPLETVKLDYQRVGDNNFTREVTLITNNPSGLFEDIVNTTFLLRIGPWIVNASFLTQFNYEGSWAIKGFTVVVQPSISLYVSSTTISLGQKIGFNGLMFACIPCINDHVNVTLSRPDGSSTSLVLPLSAIGGPYPGGYYEGTFMPDKPGMWRILVVWEGNNVSLPTQSQVQEFNVAAPSAVSSIIYPLLVIGAALVVVLGLVWQRRRGARRGLPAG